ncbi:dihydrofolate reductase family protein [Klebsiella sp. BIGb0407]|uniref:dihydrofolate reductase family protein n=1 Tax=Klebsiella sp. BIGb0407 TaxID=2940603 RepID=UPI00216A5C91|nr:dihydrofolate reductase family protein [Klebsiella sp. BIGb0407]MCS3429588.1 dihydrofolate reductase [Klebsiella sp. BIGb0407]
MSKIIYYVAASQDGYIATTDHQLDWLENFPQAEDATPYETFYQTIGAVVMGAETYRWIMTHSAHHWPYSQIPAFVISSHALIIPEDLNITQITDDAGAVAERARLAAKGKDVWLVGGGKTAAWFADAGELQQLFITTIPVFLGQGIEILPVKQTISTLPHSSRVLSNGATENVINLLPTRQ